MSISSPKDFKATCACPSCESEKPHKPDKCRRKAKWYLEFHALDKCLTAEKRQVIVCQQCFDAHVVLAVTIIAWGMAGLRPTTCGDCTRPLVRLSSLIEDVGKL